MIMAPKPLLLKDFLALDSNSDSCNNGFSCMPRRAEPTMRGLIAADGRLTRSRSKAALSKLSAVIKLFASSAAAAEGRTTFLLSRSFSKKLTRSFWKKRDVVTVAEKAAPAASRSVRVRDIVRLRSFQEADVVDRRYLYFPGAANAAVSRSSSSSSSEDGESSGSDFLLSSCGSSEISGEHDAGAGEGESKRCSPRRSPRTMNGHAPGVGGDQPAAGRRDHKDEEQEIDHQDIECHSAEEKDQLSPVSIMDFPYQDEEEYNEDENEEDNTTSPCFQQTLANIERTRHQLLQKIRRFESLAQLDMVPSNLDSQLEEQKSSHHMASDEDDDTTADDTAWAILCQLEARVGQQESSIEKLLLGFFTEGLSSCSDNISNVIRSRLMRRRHDTSAEKLIDAASNWLINEGGCCEEVVGAAQVREMETSGNWTCFNGEAEEVAAVVGDGVMRWLVDELVLDLVSC